MFIYTSQQATYYSIMFVLTTILCLLLSKYLDKNNEKLRKLPLRIIAGIILFIEVVKQIYNAVGLDCTDLLSIFTLKRSNFDLYALPFHFCSFFSVMVSLTLFTKGKANEIIECIAYGCSAIISMAMFLLPDTICGGEINRLINGQVNYLSHTIVYHTLVFVYFALESALHTSKFKQNLWWIGFLVFPIYSLFAVPAAWIFKQNYCSFLEPIGSGNIFATLVNIGPFWYTVLFVSAATILGVAFYALVNHFRDTYKYYNKTYIYYGFIIFGAVNLLMFILSIFTSAVASIFIPVEALLIISILIYSSFKREEKRD